MEASSYTVSRKDAKASECNLLPTSKHLTFLLASPAGALSRRVMLSFRLLTVSAGVRVFCRLKKFIVGLVLYGMGRSCVFVYLYSGRIQINQEYILCRIPTLQYLRQ